MLGDLWDRHVLPHLVRKACSGSPIARQRGKIVPQASGRVLEVGIGAGFNLPFYVPGQVRSVVGLDPADALTVDARLAATSSPFPVEIVAGLAESMPFERATFDTALITWTLCSVVDVDVVLSEVRRVLAPGGRLLFAEHGLAPDASVRRMQALLNPAWRRLGGGCHLDRPFPDLIETAGFQLEQIEAMYLPGPRWLNYHTWGSARP